MINFKSILKISIIFLVLTITVNTVTVNAKTNFFEEVEDKIKAAIEESLEEVREEEKTKGEVDPAVLEEVKKMCEKMLKDIGVEKIIEKADWEEKFDEIIGNLEKEETKEEVDDTVKEEPNKEEIDKLLDKMLKDFGISSSKKELNDAIQNILKDFKENSPQTIEEKLEAFKVQQQQDIDKYSKELTTQIEIIKDLGKGDSFKELISILGVKKDVIITKLKENSDTYINELNELLKNGASEEEIVAKMAEIAKAMKQLKEDLIAQMKEVKEEVTVEEVKVANKELIEKAKEVFKKFGAGDISETVKNLIDKAMEKVEEIKPEEGTENATELINLKSTLLESIKKVVSDFDIELLENIKVVDSEFIKGDKEELVKKLVGDVEITQFTQSAIDKILATGQKFKVEDGKEYTLVVKGDVTRDGEVSVTDISKAKMALAEMVGLDNDQSKALDLNDDGQISITDLSLIKKAFIK